MPGPLIFVLIIALCGALDIGLHMAAGDLMPMPSGFSVVQPAARVAGTKLAAVAAYRRSHPAKTHGAGIHSAAGDRGGVG